MTFLKIEYQTINTICIHQSNVSQIVTTVISLWNFILFSYKHVLRNHKRVRLSHHYSNIFCYIHICVYFAKLKSTANILSIIYIILLMRYFVKYHQWKNLQINVLYINLCKLYFPKYSQLKGSVLTFNTMWKFPSFQIPVSMNKTIMWLHLLCVLGYKYIYNNPIYVTCNATSTTFVRT